MVSTEDRRLHLVPLGGLGEFGLNAMVVEWQGHLLLVDAGVMFPSAEMPGVDSVVPDFRPSRAVPMAMFAGQPPTAFEKEAMSSRRPPTCCP